MRSFQTGSVPDETVLVRMLLVLPGLDALGNVTATMNSGEPSSSRRPRRAQCTWTWSARCSERSAIAQSPTEMHKKQKKKPKNKKKKAEKERKQMHKHSISSS